MQLAEHSLQQVPVDIREQVQRACEVIAAHLGEQLQAIHLYGSAVFGGLKPLSDVDLLVSSATALPLKVREALMRDLLEVSAPPGSGVLRALEVTVLSRDEVKPWRHPARRELQFGEWLRADIQAGRIESPMIDQDIALLVTQARQYSVAMVGESATAWFDPVPWQDVRLALRECLTQWHGADDWAGDERNVMLALARIWYSATTGEIASKDVAALWAQQRLSPEHAAVMAAACDAYLQGHDSELVLNHAGSLIRHLKSVIDPVLQ